MFLNQLIFKKNKLQKNWTTKEVYYFTEMRFLLSEWKSFVVVFGGWNGSLINCFIFWASSLILLWGKMEWGERLASNKFLLPDIENFRINHNKQV